MDEEELCERICQLEKELNETQAKINAAITYIKKETIWDDERELGTNLYDAQIEELLKILRSK